MAEKIYFTAKELQERWNISASTFRKMRLADSLPVTTKLHDATLYHINDISKTENEMREPVSGGAK